jgi:thiamine-phosphate diphosphorylase
MMRRAVRWLRRAMPSGRNAFLVFPATTSLHVARRRQKRAPYLAFGSVFPSRTKPGAVRAPLELLGEARRRFGLPVAAIGGISLDNAPQVIDAGADMLAVVSDLFDAMDIKARAQAYQQLFNPAAKSDGAGSAS